MSRPYWDKITPDLSRPGQGNIQRDAHRALERDIAELQRATGSSGTVITVASLPDEGNYFLLSGRASNQEAYGGTSTTGYLWLQSSSGATASTLARIQVTSTPDIIFDIPSGSVDPFQFSLGLASGTFTTRAVDHSYVGSGGASSTWTVDNRSGSAASVPATIIAHASQSADLFRVRSSVPANVMSVDSTGKVIATTGWRNPHNSEWPATSLTTLTSSPVAYNVGNVTFIRQDATGTRQVRGIANGTDGRFLFWKVTGSTAYQFNHLDAGASAGNKIRTSTALNVAANLNNAYLLIYDPTAAEWFLQKWAEPGGTETITGAWTWNSALTIDCTGGGSLVLNGDVSSFLNASIQFYDVVSGFTGVLEPATLTADAAWSLPDLGTGKTLAATTGVQTFQSKVLETSNTLRTSTQTTGVAHVDSSDTSKALRWILSNLVTGSSNAIDVITSLSTLFKLPNLGTSNYDIIATGTDVVCSGGDVTTYEGDMVLTYT